MSDVGGVSLSPAESDKKFPTTPEEWRAHFDAVAGSDEDSYRLGQSSLARWQDVDSWREPDPEPWDWQEF